MPIAYRSPFRALHAMFALLALLAAGGTLSSRAVLAADAPATGEPANLVEPISSGQLDPLVIRLGVDTFTLTLGHPDPTVTSIVVPANQNVFTVDGVPVSSLELPAQGNGTFTISGIGLINQTGSLGSPTIFTNNVLLKFQDGTTQTAPDPLGFGFRFIDPAVPVPEVTDLASDVRATSHVVSISRQPFGTFPREFPLRREITSRYYEFFPDDRNFLIISAAYPSVFSSGDSLPVKNDVLGIGRDIFDDSSIFGSNGILEQVISIRRGSVNNAGLLVHELTHRWAAFLGLGLTDPTSHWGVLDLETGDHGGGIMEQIDETTFRVTQDLGPFHYNNLELYVAGLADLSEVPFPVRALVNPVLTGNEPCPPELEPCRVFIFSADAVLEVSEEDILAAHGPRVPGATVPQHYRAGMAVAHTRLLSPVELAYYHLAMVEFEKPSSDILEDESLREIFRERATISTALECVDPDADDVCTGADSCPTLPNHDQNPEICDQRIVNIRVGLESPEGMGSGTVTWTTTHEVDLTGFNVVRIDGQGIRTQLNTGPVSCVSCSDGASHDYTFIIPKHQGGLNLFIEGVCESDCTGPFGPADRFEIGGPN